MNKAAFYDLDGTLLTCNLVNMHAYYARNDRSLVKGALQFMKVLASVPFLVAAELYSRRSFNKVAFKAYKRMHRDRLIGLADDLFEVVLKPSIFPGAKRLIDNTRDAGYRNVLVTGTLDFEVRPIAEHFGFDDIICNRLEFKQHEATGGFHEPLVAEKGKARLIEEFAKKEGMRLEDCCAFSDSSADVPMLEAVGHPVATNPSMALRFIAWRRGWHVIELRKGTCNLPPFLRTAKAV